MISLSKFCSVQFIHLHVCVCCSGSERRSADRQEQAEGLQPEEEGCQGDGGGRWTHWELADVGTPHPRPLRHSGPRAHEEQHGESSGRFIARCVLVYCHPVRAQGSH